MSIEKNKTLSRRVDEELFNQGNLSLADEFFTETYVYHEPTSGQELRGPENVKQFVKMFRTAFPDLHLTIEDQVAEGDKVAYRWTAQGTHQGELMGIPPTGNRVQFKGIAIARFANGKIEEIWENYDSLGLMQKLGVVPTPEPVE